MLLDFFELFCSYKGQICLSGGPAGNNPSTQTLYTVNTCDIETKARDWGCATMNIQQGVVSHRPSSASCRIFFLCFLRWIYHCVWPLTHQAGKSYYTCGHVKKSHYRRFPVQCLGLRMATWGKEFLEIWLQIFRCHNRLHTNVATLKPCFYILS